MGEETAKRHAMQPTERVGLGGANRAQGDGRIPMRTEAIDATATTRQKERCGEWVPESERLHLTAGPTRRGSGVTRSTRVESQVRIDGSEGIANGGTTRS